MDWRVLTVTCLTLIKLSTGEVTQYTNGFVVQVEGGTDLVRSIAEKHGFYIDEEIPDLNAYHLIHPGVKQRSKRSADHHLSKLSGDPRIKYAAQQKHLVREKRFRHIVYDKQRDFEYEEVANKSMYQRFVPEENGRLQTKDNIGVVRMEMKFSDPYYPDEWYLINKGQTGGLPGMDLNVQTAWKMGYTGKGVVTCILDDGIDHTHPDLIDNYDPQASADFNDKSDSHNDPMPRDDPYNSHGTRCAGEIAAKANNDNCGVGVAYDAKIGGVRMLDGGVTDFLEAKALSFKLNYVDVFSSSWGPKDDGKTIEGPYPMAVEAFKNGVLKGRNGLGSIYVWATGNGGLTNDDCNADGYVSRPETLSIGSVNDCGARPYFMEVCPSTLAVVPTGGYASPTEMNMEHQPKIKVVTTDLHKECTLGFQGTSSAAPIAAGCIALVLQANPFLTWRDVQHIVVHSSRIPINDGSWIQNGAGFHVSPNFGFGVLDCSRMVMLAQNWTNVPERHICASQLQQVDKAIESGGKLSLTLESDACAGNDDVCINSLEHVQINIKMNLSYRGDCQIVLMSPQGTRSEMLSPRPADNSSKGIDFTFTTVQMWGEDPRGTWTLIVRDHSKESKRNNEGRIDHWTLILHGFYWNSHAYGSTKSHAGDFQERSFAHNSKERKSYIPDKKEVDLIMAREKEQSLTVNIKQFENPNESNDHSLHVDTKPEKNIKLSSKELDTLSDLLDAFKKRKATNGKTSNLKRTLQSIVNKKTLDKKENLKASSLDTVWKDNPELLLDIGKRVDNLLKIIKSSDSNVKSGNTNSVKNSNLKRLLSTSPDSTSSDQKPRKKLPISETDQFDKALDRIKELLKDQTSE